MTNDQLATTLRGLLTASIDAIIADHAAQCPIPYCTFGVNTHLLDEIEAVKQHSLLLRRSSAHPETLLKVEKYVTSAASEPLILFGPVGSGKSVLSAQIEQNIQDWLPSCCFILRYAGLTSNSSNVASLLGSIVEQLHYFVRGEPYGKAHVRPLISPIQLILSIRDILNNFANQKNKNVAFRLLQKMEEYAATLKECIDECKYKVVILIDSLDDLSELDELSWLPSQLGENAKVVITATTAGWDITDATQCGSPGVLGSLRDRLPKESFVQLHQYSGEKWDDIMTAGNDCSYANPQMWRNCVERTPAQAKVRFCPRNWMKMSSR